MMMSLLFLVTPIILFVGVIESVLQYLDHGLLGSFAGCSFLQYMEFGSLLELSFCYPNDITRHRPYQSVLQLERESIDPISTGPKKDGGEPLLLVHGLFVNSDHWRKSLVDLGNQGYQVYALDLLGCGYSDKPNRNSVVAQKLNAEITRFGNDPGVLPNVTLGSWDGGERIRNVELRQYVFLFFGGGGGGGGVFCLYAKTFFFRYHRLLLEWSLLSKRRVSLVQQYCSLI